MSYVTTLPEVMTAAAGRLQVIGMAVSAANSSAAFPITGVVPAAADEVSALTAGRFAAYGQMYQTISAEAAAIHERFVGTLGRSADSYAAAEAANARQTAGGHFGPAMPARMIPAGPTRPAPALPTRVAPPAPNRVVPAAPGRPAGLPARPMPASPSLAPAASGWHGGGYGTPQHGGYAGYGAANYGGHRAPYGGGNYGGHPAARVEHVAPAQMAPSQHVEHVAPAQMAPLEHVARADLAAQHVSPSQVAPAAPVHREAVAAAIPAEKVLPMHLPAPTPAEHVVRAGAAFKAAAGSKPLLALA